MFGLSPSCAPAVWLWICDDYFLTGGKALEWFLGRDGGASRPSWRVERALQQSNQPPKISDYCMIYDAAFGGGGAGVVLGGMDRETETGQGHRQNRKVGIGSEIERNRGIRGNRGMRGKASVAVAQRKRYPHDSSRLPE